MEELNQVQVQTLINRAYAIDQTIFNKYLGKEVVVDFEPSPMGMVSATLIKHGAQFVSLENLKHYECSSFRFLLDAKAYIPNSFSKLKPEFTQKALDLNKSAISSIQSLEDFIEAVNIKKEE